ncbi:hypothetical protein IFO70_22080 [Phormidium tenue FACHB-886]|nr:hypothetical protein [Phormidium tenue FACHB-886]
MKLLCKKLWFRFLRKTYPWTALVLLGWRIVWACEVQLIREQVRFMVTLTKLDWTALTAIAMDLLVPEAWV